MSYLGSFAWGEFRSLKTKWLTRLSVYVERKNVCKWSLVYLQVGKFLWSFLLTQFFLTFCRVGIFFFWTRLGATKSIVLKNDFCCKVLRLYVLWESFFHFSLVCGILLYQAPTTPLNILSVIFDLPQTLTWISRKIIFPTSDIETHTRDIQRATISQTQNK